MTQQKRPPVSPCVPVRVGMIVCGNNSVEVDRITTYMMGFDPEQNKLIQEAVRRGFNDPDVEIIGNVRVTKFRPAISSLIDEKTKHDFPNLLALVGRTNNDAPKVTDINAVTPEITFQIEQACSGGCLAATKSGLDYYNFTAKARRDFSLCIIEGSGIVIEGKRWWFDRNGQPYSEQDIAALPMKKMAMGNCAGTAKHLADYHAHGCCDPAKCMTVVCKAAGVTMPIMSPKNKNLLKMVTGMIKTVTVRRKHIKNGRWVDCPHAQEDKIYELPELAQEDREKDYIEWPLPVMSKEEKKQQLKDQYRIITSAL